MGYGRSASHRPTRNRPISTSCTAQPPVYGGWPNATRNSRLLPPPPFLPFQRFNGLWPHTSSVLRNNDERFAEIFQFDRDSSKEFFDSWWDVLTYLREIFICMYYLFGFVCNKFFILENLISRYFSIICTFLRGYEENDVDICDARNNRLSLALIIWRLRRNGFSRNFYSQILRRCKKIVWMEYDVHLQGIYSRETLNSP